MQPLFMASDLKSFKKYSRGFLLLSYLTLWFICPKKKKNDGCCSQKKFIQEVVLLHNNMIPGS